jgi:hypothetical protein
MGPSSTQGAMMPRVVRAATLFTRDLVALEEAADCAITKRQSLFAQAITQFLDGDVGGGLEQSHDRRLMGINPVRLAISAGHRLGPARAFASGLRSPR